MTLALKVFLIFVFVVGTLWAYVQHRAQQYEARAEAAFPPEGKLLMVDGQQVHAVVAGEGPDLVLIHGSSGNTRDMTFAFARDLATDYRVIIIDRPGLGYTERINRTGATVSQQADLLRKTAEKLGAKRPIVFGHSYGGAVALAWAVNHPDDLSALVVQSGASKPWESGLSTYYRILSHPVLGPLVTPFITAFVPDERVEREVSLIFAPQSAPEGYASYVGPGLTLRRDSLRANALQRANLLDEVTALHPNYDQISVPTEIIHGTADTTVSMSIHAVPLSKQISDAQLTLLNGIGHMPHHSAPDQVIEVIHRAAVRAGLRTAP